MAFSIKPMALPSKGWIWIVWASGVEMVASDFKGVSAP